MTDAMMTLNYHLPQPLTLALLFRKQLEIIQINANKKNWAKTKDRKIQSMARVKKRVQQ